ncbi:Transposon Ty3-I Gag-Pol polyprotein [Folsomia candida]|uniref:RNA-directed DNA polymerase n=1 Tax=Folsomia candida TaxID=158441 RepID=A0A226EB06_FOLCA|nr:Transposon Ty3-I Gag-Pol polyprotein [Folsomia candida]
MGPPVTLNAKTRVGYLSPAQEIYHFNTNPTPLMHNNRPSRITPEQLEQLKLASDLDPSQIAELKSLLSEYADIFCWDSANLSDLGRYLGPLDKDADGVRLFVKDHSPIMQKHYKMSMHEREFLQKHLTMLEKAGLIKNGPCSSTSPTLLVKKPNGSLRLVIDMRKINSTALHDCHQILPEIEDIFTMLADFKYLSTTDLSNGYWQIPVDGRDQHITGMSTPDGTYEWLVLPQGLTTSPFIFQNIMRKIFHQQIFKWMFVYLDDLIIFSFSWTQHLLHLRQFFDKLRAVNMTLSPSKCLFATGSARVLGYILSRDGKVAPNPNKTAAIVNMPPALDSKGKVDLTKLRAFVGCVSFYRRFVEKFSARAQPLYNLTKKGQILSWNDKAQAAIEDLRHALTQPPISVGFGHSIPCILHTDSSDYAISGVLHQKTEDDDLVVICFISRLLGIHEINYTCAEKECLAVVWSINKLRPYLYAKKFTVVSDNHAVCSLLQMKCSKNRRLNRWLYTLSAHQLIITYSSGKTHYPADCLSRLISYEKPTSKKDESVDQIPQVNYLTPGDYRKEIETAQETDPVLSKIKIQCAQNMPVQHYLVYNNLIYHQKHDKAAWKLAIPAALISRILYAFHDHRCAGHLGREKTQERIQKLFFGPTLVKDVDNYVASCITCKQIKSRNTLPLAIMKSHEIVSSPFQRVFFDVCGPLKPSKPYQHQFCYVAIDSLTRFVVAGSAKSYNAQSVAKFLLNSIIFVHGCPETIVWDNHATHRSNLSRILFEKLNIQPQFTSSYSSTGNAAAERCIRSVENILACYVSQTYQEWGYYLPSVVFAINTAINDSTGLSPYFLLMGRHPRMPEDLIAFWIRNLIKIIESRNLNRLSEQKLFTSNGYDLFQRVMSIFPLMIPLDFRINIYRNPVQNLLTLAKLCLSRINPFYLQELVQGDILKSQIDSKILGGPNSFVIKINSSFILVMRLIYLFLLLLTDAWGADPSSRIHVLSGVFIKPVPNDVIVFEDTTPIFFKVKFEFATRQNYFVQDLRDQCIHLESGRGSLSPVCLLGPYLQGNFDAITNRLDNMYQALTALTPPNPPMERINTLINNNRRYPEFLQIDPPEPTIREYVITTEQPFEIPTVPTQPSVVGDPSDPRTRVQSEHDDLIRRTLLKPRPPINQMRIHIPPSTTKLPPRPMADLSAENFYERHANLTRYGRSVQWEIFSNSNNSRPKRQAALAALTLGWVGSQIYNYVDPPSESTNFNQRYDNLLHNVDANSQNAIRFADVINKQNHLMGDSLVNISSYLGTRIRQNNNHIEDISKSMREGALRGFLFNARLAEDIYRSLELTQYANIQTACMNGKLSLQAVDYLMLKRELVKLKPTNRTIVIPMNQLSSYYHHQFVKCSFDQKQSTTDIQLTIPIKTTKESVQIAELFSLPFYHHSIQHIPQICHLAHSHDFVIIKNNMPFPISMADNTNCKLSECICQYFSLSTKVSSHAGCVKALLAPQGTRYEELHQACPFNCRLTNHEEVLVTKLGWHESYYRFAITQPPLTASIICVNNTATQKFELLKSFNTSSYGVYIVEITCNCHISLGKSHPVVVPPFPCITGNPDVIAFNFPKINLIIPSRWSKINIAEISKANIYNQPLYSTEGFTNLSDIYNPQWFTTDLVISPSPNSNLPIPWTIIFLPIIIC